MRRAPELRRAGSWTASAEAATVTLPCADRHRRRILMRDDAGSEFLLDLPEAMQLRDGDGLVLEDGAIIRVVAAAEPVAEVVSADPLLLTRVAWHLGNRHTPIQILPGGLRFGHDHVLEAMVEGLGATVHRTLAPFQPEDGAYAGGHGHGHGHGHTHDHGEGAHAH